MISGRKGVEPACIKGDGTAAYRIVRSGCEHIAAAVNFIYRVAVQSDVCGHSIRSRFGEGNGLGILLRIRIQHDAGGACIAHVPHLVGGFGVDDIFAVGCYGEGIGVGFPLLLGRCFQRFERSIGNVRHKIFRPGNAGTRIIRCCYLHRLRILEEEAKGMAAGEGAPLVFFKVNGHRGRCIVTSHALDRHILVLVNVGNGIYAVFFGQHCTVCLHSKGGGFIIPFRNFQRKAVAAALRHRAGAAACRCCGVAIAGWQRDGIADALFNLYGFVIRIVFQGITFRIYQGESLRHVGLRNAPGYILVLAVRFIIGVDGKPRARICGIGIL